MNTVNVLTYPAESVERTNVVWVQLQSSGKVLSCQLHPFVCAFCVSHFSITLMVEMVVRITKNQLLPTEPSFLITTALQQLSDSASNASFLCSLTH